MSKYTDAMVGALTSRETWDNAAAAAFASEHGLSTRSVVSKILSLGLTYVKADKPARKTDGVRKADVVRAIEAALSVPAESLAGLAKADRAALDSLLRVVG
ncbi:MAG: hypothetical protein ACO208_03935 [Candidatus Puniceispirillaceae bacterium]